MMDWPTTQTLVKACILLVLALLAYFAFGWGMYTRERLWQRVALGSVVLIFAIALFGCAKAPVIQPVRYQPVDVLITKPCLAARKLPEPAELLTVPKCTKSAAECVRDAAADIDALKTEAAQARKLLQECSR